MSDLSSDTAVVSRATLDPYLALIRAPFLVFTLVVVSVPVAVAVDAGTFDPANTLLALGSVLFAHIAVNVLNIASEYRTGLDEQTEETAYSGGSDVLTNGELNYRRAVVAGALSVGISALLIVPLVVEFGAVVFLLYGIGTGLVVGYTDLFARIGLGELACGVWLALLLTVAIGDIQAGTLLDPLFATLVRMFVVGFNLLLLNKFLDVEPDRENGRTSTP